MNACYRSEYTVASRLRRGLSAGLASLALLGATGMAHAQAGSPDALIKVVATDVLDAVKADSSIKAGDLQKVMALVDSKVMPHIDFPRMTASAVGHYWRQATPQQRQQLEEQFKTLLVRTYAGALTQVSDQTVEIKPTRPSANPDEVIVRTEVKGRGDSVQLDYRLEKSGATWKIYDVNVLGVWLGENYRNSFAQEIGAHGIDGLISRLTERNKNLADRGGKS